VSKGRIEISYRCKTCNRLVHINLPEADWIELKDGYPFDAVFGDRAISFQYFKLGICKNHE
jgi:hypothetical protein